MKWLAAARTIVERKTAYHVDPQTGALCPPSRPRRVLLDLFTASMLVNVAGALSPTNREKFTALPILRAVDIGWAVLKKAEA
jgi:hypothetical protein